MRFISLSKKFEWLPPVWLCNSLNLAAISSTKQIMKTPPAISSWGSDLQHQVRIDGCDPAMLLGSCWIEVSMRYECVLDLCDHCDEGR